ncbi:hypothetical protein L6164_015657 [Bauhinia variegata]|uniref:Uncharacterized protein n=1 Tax=Bauhinia variegata TaxID=167791 RepID=A0ACB9NL65_BAUVA|nr:hypothetical protein L6164_015657 [Bauhinia variegata]
MELDKLNDLKQEPHLSGAYIRSLVKQLATSRTKDSMNPKDLGCVVDADSSPGTNSTKNGKIIEPRQQQAQQPQQHKKQVRRRLHTSRPYQERLLNMAEARREIVTALKFHRAAMKQASEQQQKPQQPQEQRQQSSVSLQPSHQLCFEEDGRTKPRRNPRIYPSSTTNFPNYMDSFAYSSFSHPPPLAPNPFSWPAASPVTPPLLAENPNFILPNQTLGLNLNFHDFNNLDTTLHLNSHNTSLYSYASPSSSSPPLSVVTDQEVPSVAISQGEGTSALVDTIESSAASQFTGGLHTVMDDEGMAEIRSLGEQHQMEWNDTMNLVTSAWWFKCLKNMELGGTEAQTEEDEYHVFGELMEFPSWLNANESCLEQCSADYYQDPSLPCMDIGDIEGIDGEWLA